MAKLGLTLSVNTHMTALRIKAFCLIFFNICVLALPMNWVVAQPLQGGVEHTEVLPPLSGPVRKGAIFNEGQMMAPDPMIYNLRLERQRQRQPLQGSVNQQGAPNLTPLGAEQGAPLSGQAQGGAPLSGLVDIKQLQSGQGQYRPPLQGGAQELNFDPWVRIPVWFAGTWERLKGNVVSRYSYSSRRWRPGGAPFDARVQISYGMQPDKYGGIWHYIGDPISVRDEHKNILIFHRLDVIDLINQNEQAVDIRIFNKGVEATYRDGRIFSTFRQEELQHITLIGRGVTRWQISAKVFSERGNPDNIRLHDETFNLIRPFYPVDWFQGKDMRLSFRNFLYGKHLEHLMPDALANYQPGR
jgi:hypothetical protein